MSRQIGFIGLGTMGSAMARRLVDAGHDLRVWNRSAPAVERLVAAGATGCATPEEALEAEVSISMLADDAATEAVLTDAAVTRARGIHIGMASLSPAESDVLEARFSAVGVGYLAAPVLGRPSVAAEGGLNILAAGAEDTVAQVRPILEAMGKRIWNLGERPRVANVAKVVVNYNIIHAIHAIGESLALTEPQGIDPEQFVELMTSTLFGGVVYSGYGRMIVAQGYDPPGFAISLGYKDLRLAAEVAAESGVFAPTMPALQRVFERALADDELARLDWGAAAEVTRRGLLNAGGDAAAKETKKEST